MSDLKDYAQMVSAAESAVSSVKDAKLRQTAFQVVLEDLLTGDSKSSAPHGRTSGKPRDRSREVDAGKGKGAKQSKGGTQTYVDELLSEGFFKKQRSIADLKAELEVRGYHIPVTSLSGPLQRMCKERKLRRQKVAKSESRPTYSYSNW